MYIDSNLQFYELDQNTRDFSHEMNGLFFDFFQIICYIIGVNKEVEYNELIFLKCKTRAENMQDEANTLLHCPCGNSFYQNIWDDEDTLIKRHYETYKKT